MLHMLAVMFVGFGYLFWSVWSKALSMAAHDLASIGLLMVSAARWIVFRFR